MVNTSTTSPSATSESAEKKIKNSTGDIRDLARDAVSQYMRIHQDPADILQSLRVDADKERILSEIRTSMQTIYSTDTTEYSIPAPTEIGNFDTEILMNILNIHLLSTRSLQDALEQRIRKHFIEDVFADTLRGNIRKTQMMNWIHTQKSYDIPKILREKRFLREMYILFADDADIDTQSTRSFEQIFTKLGIDIRTLSDTDKEIFALADTVPSTILLTPAQGARILGIINTSPATADAKKSAKRQYLIDHFHSLSIDTLRTAGLITDVQIRDYMRSCASSTLDSISDDAEKERYLDDICKVCGDVHVPCIHFIDGKMIYLDDPDTQKKIDTLISADILASTNERISARTEAYNHYSYYEKNVVIGQNGEQHTGFLDLVAGIKDGNGSTKVQNANNIQVGNTLCIDGVYYTVRTTEIDKDIGGIMLSRKDINGSFIRLRGISLEKISDDAGIFKNIGKKENIGYGPFLRAIAEAGTVRVLTPTEVDVLRTAQRAAAPAAGAPVDPVDTLENSIDTYTDLKEKLTIYSEKDWSDMDIGMSYESKPQIGGGGRMRFRILGFSDTAHTLSIRFFDGTILDVPYIRFLETVKDMSITSVGEVGTKDKTVSLLMSKKIWGGKTMTYENGKIMLTYKKKVPNSHGHGPTEEKEIKEELTHMYSLNGEIMHIYGIDDDGNIQFGMGKFESPRDWTNWQKRMKSADPRGTEKLPPLTPDTDILDDTYMIEEFFEEVENNDLMPYIDPVNAQVDDDIEGNLPHMHSDPIGSFLQGYSLKDMGKGFELYFHAWEHKLGKSSKFNAARFADRNLSWAMPKGFAYQLRSEVYNSQNETMEEIIKMLEGFNGKEARMYIRDKILLNTSARFEEVCAGLLYIVEKTGSLYPEELSDLANSKVWFHQLTRTFGVGTKAQREELWKKSKAKSDKGPELYTEADVVERLLKLYEGGTYEYGWRIPPNLAAKFPGKLAQGFQDGKEKGAKEVEQRNTVDQMNAYALSKLRVGEGPKTIGTLDRIYGKNGSAKQLNKIPFCLIMSNLSETLGSEYGKMLHSQAVGENIRTSTALMFGNDKKKADMYRKMVMKVTEEYARRSTANGSTKGTIALEKLRRIESERPLLGYEDHRLDGDKEKTKYEERQANFVDSIAGFWDAYSDHIQPMLQMVDPYIKFKSLLKEGDPGYDPLFVDYTGRVEAITGMQRERDNIMRTDGVGEGNFKMDHTPPPDIKNAIYIAADGIHPQGGNMDAVKHAKVFTPAVIGGLEYLRAITSEQIGGAGGDAVRKFQKHQFETYYLSLMFYMRPKIKARIRGNAIAEKQSSFNDIMTQGFMTELKRQGIEFVLEDFISANNSIPANAILSKEYNTDNPMNPENIWDGNDKQRCDALFETFLAARPVGTGRRNFNNDVHMTLSASGGSDALNNPIPVATGNTPYDAMGT